ncbi:hypothetical protein PMIN01_07622 [Paraphaeosphaeria minitans]|uniref:Uncharacterized protein n=1 Tax=Paraphaeosphaeria minitans TaxID=565426 RepID=A0A9P6GID6_9PLEO|nr:hypothetical protein PMIN01_07622 [Paraphaeosphaeria minitans]
MANHTDFRRLANPCTSTSAHADWRYSLFALDGEGEAWKRGACVTESSTSRSRKRFVCCGEEVLASQPCKGLCRIQMV